MPPNRELDSDDLDSGPENTVQARAPELPPEIADDLSLDRATDRRIVPDDNEPPSRPMPPRSQFGAISTPTQFTPKNNVPGAPSSSPAVSPSSAPEPVTPRPAQAPMPQPMPARSSVGPMPARTSSSQMPARSSSSPMPARTSTVPPQPARNSAPPAPPVRSSAPPQQQQSQHPQSVRSPIAQHQSVRLPAAEQAPTITPASGYSSGARMPSANPMSMGQGQSQHGTQPPPPSHREPPQQQQQQHQQQMPMHMQHQQMQQQSPMQSGPPASMGGMPQQMQMPQQSAMSAGSGMSSMHSGFGSASQMQGAPPPLVAPQPMSTPQRPGGGQPGGHTMTGFVPPAAQSAPSPGVQTAGMQQALALRADGPRDLRSAAFHVVRSRAYSFILDQRGVPVEIGSGRFAKAYLGEERWLESKTDYRRDIVIKILQKGVSEDDHMRFQMEQELLERVQGHPNIVELLASGEGEDIQFLPPTIRDKVEPEFMILERLEMSLEERLKGSRHKAHKDDLLGCDMRERIFRVLDYMIPIASAIEYAHLVRNICHRDLKPANVLVKLPDPNLRGSTLEVRLADFNVAKLADDDVQLGMTAMKASVPGTLYFQSPEQETNVIELLVNVQNGVPEVEFFEDFYVQIAKNDTFSLWNRGESYPVLYADRARKRVVLARPYRDVTETNVRARVQKSVGRPADIYSLGAMLYYLISGAYSNPKTLYDAFHKFIEYERADETNTIESYLMHEYSVINSLRAPKTEGGQGVAPADRFFSYKHYLDGNGELVDPNVMLIVAKCMIRNKPDSYCQPHDLETRGISDLVQDLINLYALYGVHPAARPTHLARRAPVRRRALGMGLSRVGDRLRQFFRGIFYRQKR